MWGSCGSGSPGTTSETSVCLCPCLCRVDRWATHRARVPVSHMASRMARAGARWENPRPSHAAIGEASGSQCLDFRALARSQVWDIKEQFFLKWLGMSLNRVKHILSYILWFVTEIVTILLKRANYLTSLNLHQHFNDGKNVSWQKVALHRPLLKSSISVQVFCFQSE